MCDSASEDAGEPTVSYRWLEIASHKATRNRVRRITSSGAEQPSIQPRALIGLIPK